MSSLRSQLPPSQQQQKFPWFLVTTCDPRNKDSKMKQNATGRHSNRKYRHVCQFLGPMMDLQVQYWGHERKSAVLPQVMEANYIWIRSNSWQREGVCAHLCLFVFAIEMQRRMEIRYYMKWNRVKGVNVGNMISAHWENLFPGLIEKTVSCSETGPSRKAKT